jgi:phosphatidyl-myo-inositol alpha-mannosyltransferase
MKIGLVCPYNIFLGGGVQECVKAIQAELVRRGHDALIITPQPRNSDIEAPKGIIFIGGAATVKSFHTTAQVSVTVSLDMVEKVLEEEKFDILHFHEPSVPMVSKQVLSRSSSINVATFHAKLPDTMMLKTIERVVTPYTKSILKDLHYLTAVSDAAADYVKGLTDRKVHIIPNGIDLEKYKKIPNTQRYKTPTILYIGRLEKRKGVKYLLNAVALMQQENPKLRLLIAGDGPDRRKLEQHAEQIGLKNVEFLGYITESEKLRLLHTATLFCSPALYGESFGIVLLEAMACGVPLVAGNNPGYSSVMKGRGFMSIVNPKDPVLFAGRMELLLYDKQLRKLWTDWALDYVQQFNYENIVDMYEALYKEALETHKLA